MVTACFLNTSLTYIHDVAKRVFHAVHEVDYARLNLMQLVCSKVDDLFSSFYNRVDFNFLQVILLKLSAKLIKILLIA